jgi:hypothetical protein
MKGKKGAKKGKNMDEGSNNRTDATADGDGEVGDASAFTGQITTKAELRSFCAAVRDKLLKGEAPPIFAMTAMQFIMGLESINDLLDTQTKEILQEIWVKLSQSGFQLTKPPLLFGDPEA